MFFTEDLAFSCAEPTNIYTFKESLGFFVKKWPQRMQNKKNMPGHVLRELHRFLERNKKHAEQKHRKKKKKKQNKKHVEQKKHSYTQKWLCPPFVFISSF